MLRSVGSARESTYNACVYVCVCVWVSECVLAYVCCKMKRNWRMENQYIFMSSCCGRTYNISGKTNANTLSLEELLLLAGMLHLNNAMRTEFGGGWGWGCGRGGNMRVVIVITLQRIFLDFTWSAKFLDKSPIHIILFLFVFVIYIFFITFCKKRINNWGPHTRVLVAAPNGMKKSLKLCALKSMLRFFAPCKRLKSSAAIAVCEGNGWRL